MQYKSIILSFFLSAGVANAQTLDSLYSTPAGMTDEQAKKALEFNHEGRKASIVKAACDKGSDLGSAGCDETKIDQSGTVIKGSMGANIEQHIGKLYGVLFGAGGLVLGNGGPTVTVKKDKDVKLSKDEKKELSKNGSVNYNDKDGGKDGGKEGQKAETKGDYCIYAVVGYELIAGMMQQNQQSQGSSDISDPQLQALVSLKKAHKTRKKTATYQALVYGATSACYIARAAASQGRVVMDTKYIAKMSAAGALAVLYNAKARKHGQAADAVQKVINSLPKNGECNPWTGTACFCKEETSKNLYPSEYQEVCVVNNGNAETPKSNLGCGVLTDGKMAFDKDCKCKANNTCFKASLTTYNPNFNLGANFMKDANKGYELLSKGEFEQGQFDKSSFSFAANASKIKAKLDTSKLPAIRLSDNQKKIADDLKDLMPGNLAGIAAASNSATPPGGGIPESGNVNLASLSPEIKAKIENETKAAYTTGSGFESAAAPEETLTLPGMETASENSDVTLTFAEQAVNNADVSKVPETPIFDIISHRYRASGWNKLQAEK